VTELRELAGQLLIVGFPGQEPPPALLRRIAAGEVGGVILFARNVAGPSQVAELNHRLRAAAPADRPLLVSVDQEGGRVQRLKQPLALWPPMRQLGALGDGQLTYAVGQAIGADLAQLGFNLDFAPVLDVVQSDENSVIGDRSFGASAERVADQGLALARGLMAGGVLPCGKHFPGHGGPVADSHVTLPVERRGREELAALDLLPFVRAIAERLPLLMSAHVLYPALDPESPATLSAAICTRLLREELGFQGALVSDDMEMGAIVERHGPGPAALAALRAGVDCLLVCHREDRQQAALDALVAAAQESAEDRRRLEQAAERVARLKRLLPSALPIVSGEVEERVAAARHAELLAALAL
jgi:beta-N-acetylhexosaminidase